MKNSSFTPKSVKKMFFSKGNKHDGRCRYCSVLMGDDFCNKHHKYSEYYCFDNKRRKNGNK